MMSVARLRTFWSSFGSSSIAETSHPTRRLRSASSVFRPAAVSATNALRPSSGSGVRFKPARLEVTELLLLPVGGGPTIGGSAAADTAELPEAEGTLAVVPAAP